MLVVIHTHKKNPTDPMTATKTTEPLPQYSVENSATYWNSRWANDQTGWKVDERKAGTADLAAKIKKMLVNEDLPLDSRLVDSEAAHTSSPLSGVNVLVPLCGDTPLLSFLWHCGMNVVGVEYNRDAALRALQEAGPHIAWKETVVDANAVPPIIDVVGWRKNNSNINNSDTNANEIAIPTAGPKLRILIGDFFTVAALTSKLLQPSSFDLVWDRGAMCAVLPAQRSAYAAIISRLINTSDAARRARNGFLFSGLAPSCRSVILASTIHRPPSTRKDQGPPFYLTAQCISSGELYTKENGFEVRELVAFDPQDGAQPPFLEGFSSVIFHASAGDEATQ